MEQVQGKKTVFAPGLAPSSETKEFINVVHILAVHGWNFNDRLNK